MTATWERHYFPNGYCHFPFYRPSFISGSVCISPFGFYFGICCPFISLSACTIYPPTVAYIDVPIYNGPVCTGYAPIEGVNYLEYSDLRTREPGLLNAVDELTEAFQSGNIDSMVSLVDPNVSIAVYERGKYQYSLASNNYLDLTRDAIRNIKTRQFNITRIEQRAPEVFVASGQHNYTDASGQSRSVYVSFVFQDFGGQWTLTQVGTAPDKVQSWQVKE